LPARSLGQQATNGVHHQISYLPTLLESSPLAGEIVRIPLWEWGCKLFSLLAT
jgi:hypothetical protein